MPRDTSKPKRAVSQMTTPRLNTPSGNPLHRPGRHIVDFRHLLRSRHTQLVHCKSFQHAIPSSQHGILEGTPLSHRSHDALAVVASMEQQPWRIIKSTSDSRQTFFLDQAGLPFAAFFPGPSSAEFHDILQDLLTASRRLEACGGAQQTEAHRGTFKTFHMMVNGPGAGAKPPESKRKEAAFNAQYNNNLDSCQAFLQNPAVENIRKYCNQRFRKSFPFLHQRYLLESKKDFWLQAGAFCWVPFASLAVNLPSSNTVSQPHRDKGDFSGGLCGVFCFGNFPEGEAALRLGELQVEVHMKPGDFILFPSSLITHWNTPMGQQYTRGVLVMFTDASVLRWSYLKPDLIEELQKKDPTQIASFHQQIRGEWWGTWQQQQEEANKALNHSM
ncbi:hypothetical protein BCV70DRAFT_220452 [Testicularia cyperi]|uniref:Clavaminate synthase-like protein n=2 Tax=Testicularia cyperi TaxID=1882483 RepID=A0A317XZR3_9BASI|nr:hypothetical protein BCV70DRAFT_220452 [Testicularia cyperi]